ncbi:MAG: LacI family transcriptional regulator [Lentisphaeria bacterium]|nr:MAG: LacI family transcriptional regulator [Lentisphaeria bacterium]
MVLNNFGWALDHVSSVFPDADGESRQALEHLVALGHRKIARLRGPVSTDRERNRGLDEFYRIAGQYGIRESVRNICASSPEEMEMHLRTLLEEGFTAFILIPIEWISRCTKTIWDCGREIPRDVSLIVYEEPAVTPFQSPPLTAFAFDYPELVRKALDQLLLEINGEKGESQIVVPTRLILRESTGPLHRHGCRKCKMMRSPDKRNTKPIRQYRNRLDHFTNHSSFCKNGKPAT